jgi:hypothetical protein
MDVNKAVDIFYKCAQTQENPIEPPAGTKVNAPDACLNALRTYLQKLPVRFAVGSVRGSSVGDPAAFKKALTAAANKYNTQQETAANPQFISSLPSGKVQYRVIGSRSGRNWRVKATITCPEAKGPLASALSAYQKTLTAGAQSWATKELNRQTATKQLVNAGDDGKYYFSNVIDEYNTIGSL